MKLKILKYEIKDVSPCERFLFCSADMPKVNLWIDSHDSNLSIDVKTETLDVIRLYKSDCSEFIFCAPMEIQNNMDWAVSILKKSLKDSEVQVRNLQSTIHRYQNMNFLQRLKFLLKG